MHISLVLWMAISMGNELQYLHLMIMIVKRMQIEGVLQLYAICYLGWDS